MAKTVMTWLQERVTALSAVAAVPGCRVYPVYIDQDHDLETTPALVYRRAKTSRDKTQKATAGHRGSTGRVVTEFVLACVGYDYVQVTGLLDAVRLDLEGYSNVSAAVANRDPEVRRVSVVDEVDDSAEPVAGEGVECFAPYLVLTIEHVEVTP